MMAPVRKVFFIPMMSAIFPPIRTNAAIIRAFRAIAACTPETVVWRSVTRAEIETFMMVLSRTTTNVPRAITTTKLFPTCRAMHLLLIKSISLSLD